MTLYGLSQEKISLELGISEGTVSTILQELKQSDETLALQHEVAVLCKKHGISIKQFAANLAFSNAIKMRAFDENKINILVEALNSIISSDSSLSPKSWADLLLQTCYLTLKIGTTPEGLYREVQEKLDVSKKLTESIEQDKRVLAQIQNQKEEALKKYDLRLKDIRKFVSCKEAFEECGLDFSMKDWVVNFLNNLKQVNYNYRRLLRKMKRIKSLEAKERELELKCDEKLKVIEIFERKLQAEMESWNAFYAAKEQFTNLVQKGISPYDMAQIFDIIIKYLSYFPIDDLAKDFETYGGIKAACYKLTKELQGLKNELALLEFKHKMMAVQ
jgi:hypothetical protein